MRRHQEAPRGEEVEREEVVSRSVPSLRLGRGRSGSLKSKLVGRWRLVSYLAIPDASNLRHIALEGARLVLSGSMSLDGRPHAIRVVWERQAE